MAWYISDRPAPGTSLALADDPKKIPPDVPDQPEVPVRSLDLLATSGGVSGLSYWHKRRAVKMVQQAAVLAWRHKWAIHYTQGPLRWEGINQHKKAWRGEFPIRADCSAFGAWVLWNGLDHFHVRDCVNGLHWLGGFTGTMMMHGRKVQSPIPGDAVFYYDHVAMYTGGGLVVSHGSEGGPYLLPWDYRHVIDVRRYI